MAERFHQPLAGAAIQLDGPGRLTNFSSRFYRILPGPSNTVGIAK